MERVSAGPPRPTRCAAIVALPEAVISAGAAAARRLGHAWTVARWPPPPAAVREGGQVRGGHVWGGVQGAGQAHRAVGGAQADQVRAGGWRAMCAV